MIQFVVTPASAQLDFSLVGGANASSARLESQISFEPARRYGYFIGVAPGYQLSAKSLVVVEAQYSLKGYNQSGNDINEVNFRYTYLDLLPAFEYELINGLSLGLGMNYGFSLREDSYTISDGPFNISDFRFIKGFDAGLLGAVKISSGRSFAFIRYNHGIRNIINHDVTDLNGEIIERPSQFNTNIQLGIGYTILRKSKAES